MVHGIQEENTEHTASCGESLVLLWIKASKRTQNMSIKQGESVRFFPFIKKIAQEEEEERIIKQTNCVMHQLLKRITKCTDSKHAIGKTDK